MSSINEFNYPNHIGIIMDGNRRWAKRKNLPAIMGHIAGSNVAWKTLLSCIKLNIKYLTMFAFSSDNWKRTENKQSDHIIKLIIYYIYHNLNKFHQADVAIRFIGSRSNLAKKNRSLLEKIEVRTCHNSKLKLFIALDYGGQWDILNATKILAQKVADNEISVAQINEEVFSSVLSTAPAPFPDLIIRTGGDTRLSNFLLWQIPYAEIFFTSILWPDFNHEELVIALNYYAEREKRYGS
ncbi:MAG: polyprenyl diphosphate synthase [Legionella sp.]|nr:polyprenyl diphosphate synthase [Legionella sp.]